VVLEAITDQAQLLPLEARPILAVVAVAVAAVKQAVQAALA
jgi:hypothetical protein